MVIRMVNHKAKDMAKQSPKKQYPPAYRRYRENHPTISIVLTKDLKNFLDSQRGDSPVSYSQLLKKFIGQAYDLDQAQQKGYQEGYTAGLNKAEQKFKRYRAMPLGKCSCGKPLVFDLENPEHLRILSQAMSDSQATHIGCQPKPIILRVPEKERT